MRKNLSHRIPSRSSCKPRKNKACPLQNTPHCLGCNCELLCHRNKIFRKHPLFFNKVCPMHRPFSGESFISLGRVSRDFATRMGWERDLRLADLRRLWRETMGDPIARVSYPLSLSESEIVVACLSPLWKRELAFLEAEVREKLVRSFPLPDSLTLTFRVVRPFRQEGKIDGPDRAKESKKLELLWKRADEIASALPEPLRERGRAFVLGQLLSGLHLGEGGRRPPRS